MHLAILLIALTLAAAGNGPAQGKSAYRTSLRTEAERHHHVAEIEEASGDYKRAAAEFEIAARMDPSEDNLFDFGSELLKYHGYVQGLKVFHYAAAKYPRSAKLQVGLGVAEYSAGQYRDAVETLCRAVDLDPKDRRALGFLGKMIGVAPDLSAEVRERLERFSKLYPNNPAANYYYAMSLRQQTTGASAQTNRRVEALLQRAVAEDPQFADAHYQLGAIYQEEGLDAKAAREYESAVRLRPDWKSAHYRLAQIYAKEGKTAMARREYETVRSLNTK